MRLNDIGSLAPYLLVCLPIIFFVIFVFESLLVQSVFAADPATRRLLRMPLKSDIDYRAICFCHRRVVDTGYICSVCLSVFCTADSAVCATCQYASTRFSPDTYRLAQGSLPRSSSREGCPLGSRRRIRRRQSNPFCVRIASHLSLCFFSLFLPARHRFFAELASQRHTRPGDPRIP